MKGRDVSFLRKQESRVPCVFQIPLTRLRLRLEPASPARGEANLLHSAKVLRGFFSFQYSKEDDPLGDDRV